MGGKGVNGRTERGFVLIREKGTAALTAVAWLTAHRSLSIPPSRVTGRGSG